MTRLSALKPTKKRNVIDLVREAGVDVSDWSNSAGGAAKAATNPKYCYNWAFVEPGKVVVLNLWYANLTEKGDLIACSINARGARSHDAQAVWIKRSEELREAVRLSRTQQLPIRVIICDGDMRRGLGREAKASTVSMRELDPVRWSVTTYDDETGAAVLERNNKPTTLPNGPAMTTPSASTTLDLNDLLATPLPAWSTFESTKEHLQNLLAEADSGELQLPDFQRGWVWDEYGIRALLASVSQGFPIGAVMLLEAGGEVKFRPRPIEGAPPKATKNTPERLILDGQQRLTSLYQACVLKQAVETRNDKGRAIKRWFYIDMTAALDPRVDREDAILGLPEDKRVTRHFGREVIVDVTTREKEFEHSLFPISSLFESDDWEDGYREYWDHDKTRSRFFQAFRKGVLDAFRQYLLPIITLKKDTSKAAVCLVFEKVNTGGKKLDAFELLTAIYAADEYNLRDDWYGSSVERVEGRLPRLAKFDVLKEIASTDFLQAISLLYTAAERENAIASGKTNPKEIPPVTCQKAALLNLPLAAYKEHADAVEEAFRRGAKLLTLQKIFSHRDVPYATQLVPLAAILVRLEQRWEDHGVRAKLARWFWCGVFGELYGSATETRFAKDFVEVLAWMAGGPEPSTIVDSATTPERLRSLRSRLSAAYKGLGALIKVRGGCDLRSGQPIEYASFWEENVDIHHIFPKDWCQKRNIHKDLFDSVVNKTPLAAATNRMIGAKAPSEYLRALEKRAGVTPKGMDDFLRTHAIESALLRKDDFNGFFAARAAALISMIEQATGKPSQRDRPEEGTPIDAGANEAMESIEIEAPLT